MRGEIRSQLLRVRALRGLCSVIGLSALLVLLIPAAEAVCLATGKACGGQTASNDRLCCPGMVCGWGNVCQSGCRITGTFYQNGALNPSNPCLTCKPSASTTSWSPKEGVACDDHNVCTQHDVCHAGACAGEDPVVCPVPDACHLPGSCDAATGTCSNPRRPDGSSCQIDNACSLGADVCEYGVCVPAGNAQCATLTGASIAFRSASAGLKGAKIGRASVPVKSARPGPETPEERRRKAFAKEVAARLAARSIARPQSTLLAPTPAENAIFDHFVGFWLRDTIDDWNQATALKFYRTAGGDLRVKFYEGTQNRLREVNDNDWWFAFNPAAPLASDVAISVIGPNALRIHNTAWPGTELSSDDLASSARIQDGNANILYAQFWTSWDGTGDDARYGAAENLSRYKRLAQPPPIQTNDQPSAINWSNPVEIFRYMHDYYSLLGQTEKLESLKQVDWVGAAGYEALYNQFRTTGVVRSATTSTLQRGGGFIGVWRTMFPSDFPFTTIHTAAPHRFTPGSALSITGFSGPYAVLNGVHSVPASPPSTWTGGMPEPWQADSSRQPYVLVDVDTSGIAVPYDPNVHGVGQLTTTHGPIVAGTEYRPFVAAAADFVLSAFGPGTHTRLQYWVRTDRTVPATFTELRQGLADGTIFGTAVLVTRDYAATGNADLYWNPWLVGGGTLAPEFNLNDPFGLGFVAQDPAFDYDIDLENYLDFASARSVFFTVTGPTLAGEPITSQLTGWGYPSNGSQVVFRTGAFATPPADLADAYGAHPFVPYGSADNDYWGNLFRYHFDLLGGMVRSELACGRKVAYIRVGDEDAFDAPLYQLSMRSLAFGRADMQSKVKSNWTAAMAALLADLEAQKPDRYILDLRRNLGGYSYVGDAFAALFGGNRPGQEAVVSIVQAGLNPGVTPLAGSGIQTGNNSLAANVAADSLIDTNEAATVFPNAIVRGDASRRVDVILLTSTHAASGGDMFPHSFLGPDPGSRVHALGYNVFARIAGDIDGRLWSGIKAYDAPGFDPVHPDLVTFWGAPRTPIYMASDSGTLIEDRLGTLVNPQTWTQPDTLLRGWYDQTGWQDLGLTPPTVSYPLGVCTKPLPVFADPYTWRDVWLEHAIVN